MMSMDSVWTGLLGRQLKNGPVVELQMAAREGVELRLWLL